MIDPRLRAALIRSDRIAVAALARRRTRIGGAGGVRGPRRAGTRRSDAVYAGVMSQAAPLSRTSRIGLLAVALLHLAATAALPFTHAHEASGTAVTLSPMPDQQNSGSADGHPDVCAICRTLTTAPTPALVATLLGAASTTTFLTIGEVDADQAPALLTTARPRAPPHA